MCIEVHLNSDGLYFGLGLDLDRTCRITVWAYYYAVADLLRDLICCYFVA